MAKTKLSQGDLKKIIDNLVCDLEGHSIKVKKIILYGSYAHGNPREFSDVDIAIVSPSFAGKGILMIQEKLARAMSKYLSVVEPIGCSPDDFSKADRASFLGEIKRTGKVIYAAA